MLIVKGSSRESSRGTGTSAPAWVSPTSHGSGPVMKANLSSCQPQTHVRRSVCLCFEELFFSALCTHLSIHLPKPERRMWRLHFGGRHTAGFPCRPPAVVHSSPWSCGIPLTSWYNLAPRRASEALWSYRQGEQECCRRESAARDPGSLRNASAGSCVTGQRA